MDAETRRAIANLAGAMELFRQEQKRQGETLAEIKKLLTPEPGEGEGPSLKELVAQLLAAIERQGANHSGYLKDIKVGLEKARRDLPLETVQAIHDNLGVPRKAA